MSSSSQQLSSFFSGYKGKIFKSSTNSSLFKLLDFNHDDEKERQKLDCGAIINEVYKNPQSAEKKYEFSDDTGDICFPLHKAIKLMAPIDVIYALCNNKSLSERGEIPLLHLALRYRSSCDVLRLLLEKRPELIMERDESKETLMHLACQYRYSMDVVAMFLDSIDETEYFAYTPLHYACRCGAPSEIVSLLLSAWPDAIRERTTHGHLPLHLACSCGSSVEVVSLLLDSWPDAIKEKIDFGLTPLHLALQVNSTQLMGVVLLLLERWPVATKEKDNNGKTPFEYAQRKNVPVDVLKPLFFVSRIYDDDLQAGYPFSPDDFLSFFIKIEWHHGVLLVIDRHPPIVKGFNLDTNVMPDFLSVVGRRCRLKTLWKVLREEQDLFSDI